VYTGRRLVRTGGPQFVLEKALFSTARSLPFTERASQVSARTIAKTAAGTWIRWSSTRTRPRRLLHRVQRAARHVRPHAVCGLVAAFMRRSLDRPGRAGRQRSVTQCPAGGVSSRSCSARTAMQSTGGR
jgi:hypothetical protein